MNWLNWNAACSGCGAEITAGRPHCATCGQSVAVATPSTSPIKIAVRPRPKIPVTAEIGITLDRTASSQTFEQGIRYLVPQLLEGVALRAARVQVYLQSHGDLDVGQDMVMHCAGGTVAEACVDLDDIVFGGGGPPQENHLDAVESLMTTIPFVKNPATHRGVIVAVMNAESKPARSGRSPEEIGRALLDQHLLTYLICEPTRKLKRLSAAARGMLVPISNNPSQKVIEQVVAEVGASIAMTLSTGGTTPL